MTRLAAVDVGTNTVRLLVADVDGERIVDVERDLEITRLGKGVDAGGRLDPEAVERTVAAVDRFVRRAREVGADRVRVAGTSALRDAADRSAFVDAVREAVDAEVEILTGTEEGHLAFRGAVAGRGKGPFVVCDVGGGSTELIRGGERVEAVRSADVGSVRVRERCLASDPPSDDEIAEARSFITGQLASVEVGIAGTEHLIGVAGTVTTLAALNLGLRDYDPDRVDGSVLTITDVRTWADRLCRMPVEDVKRLPTMQPGRADVICAGALVLRGVMERWGFEGLTASERDILHGLVADA